MQDLVKWLLKDENRAIQDALTQVGELFAVWTEVQRELTDHIKEFKHQVRSHKTSGLRGFNAVYSV